MSMLKCFFEIGRDSAPFEGLKIAQEQELCEKYMGKFPVISISLCTADRSWFVTRWVLHDDRKNGRGKCAET